MIWVLYDVSHWLIVACALGWLGVLVRISYAHVPFGHKYCTVFLNPTKLESCQVELYECIMLLLATSSTIPSFDSSSQFSGIIADEAPLCCVAAHQLLWSSGISHAYAPPTSNTSALSACELRGTGFYSWNNRELLWPKPWRVFRFSLGNWWLMRVWTVKSHWWVMCGCWLFVQPKVSSYTLSISEKKTSGDWTSIYDRQWGDRSGEDTPEPEGGLSLVGAETWTDWQTVYLKLCIADSCLPAFSLVIWNDGTEAETLRQFMNSLINWLSGTAAEHRWDIWDYCLKIRLGKIAQSVFMAGLRD